MDTSVGQEIEAVFPERERCEGHRSESCRARHFLNYNGLKFCRGLMGS